MTIGIGTMQAGLAFDEAVKGDVTALAGADYIFTAAEFIGDHLYAMDDNGQLYCFGGGDLTAAPVPWRARGPGKSG